MVQLDSIHFYSTYTPLHVQSGKNRMILFGNPGKMRTNISAQEWINDIISGLEKSVNDDQSFLIEELKNTQGLFLLIIISESEILLVSDHIRSYPLFYGYKGNSLFITDDLFKFQTHAGWFQVDYERVQEFYTTGLVYRNRTIYKNVFGLQAAEIVSISDGKIRSERYFIFKPTLNPIKYTSVTEFSRAFDELFLRSFTRLIDQHKDVNNWIVPLSGGHDSRIVVNYLCRLGVRNVICYSYGEPGNEQSRISSEVAGKLGYEWHFVEYTSEKWKNLSDNGLLGDYIDFAFNGVSTPHLQDFLAVAELVGKGILKEGDIFLPGHTVVTETVFNEETLALKDLNEAIEYVSSKVMLMSADDGSEPPTHRLLREICSELKVSPKNLMAICDWQERQAKFITNSIKVYEFFGFQSRQPMWDMELVDFWLKIPDNQRTGRQQLYLAEKHSILINPLLNTPYAKEHKNTMKLKISSVLRKILPEKLYVRILSSAGLRTSLNEGLNHIYEHVAQSVKDILDPVEDFPPDLHKYFNKYLGRCTFQMDPNKLTSLYTIRRLLNNSGDPESQTKDKQELFVGDRHNT